MVFLRLSNGMRREVVDYTFRIKITQNLAFAICRIVAKVD